MSIVAKRGVVKTLISNLFILLLGFSGIGMAFAETDAPLSWEPAGWGKPAVFHLGADQSGPILGEDGYSEEFKKILSTNPDALEEAYAAKRGANTATVGWGVILLGTVLQLKDTMDQADDPLAESDSKGLGFVIVGAVVALIGSSIYKSHMNSSIQLYNEGMKQGARDQSTQPAHSPQFKLGFSSGRSSTTKFGNTDVALLGTMQIRF